MVHKKLNKEQITALEQAGFEVTTNYLPVFYRYRLNSVTYCSSNQRRVRNSSICRVRIPSSHEVCFGSISTFCFANGVPAAVVSVYESTDDCIISESSYHSFLQPDDHAAAKCVKLFMFKVKKLSISKRLVAIPPEVILGKCVHIPIKHSPTDCIVTMPNYVEHH